MKLTRDTGIECLYCKKKMVIETGFFGALFVNTILKMIEKRGAIITCPSCKNKFQK